MRLVRSLTVSSRWIRFIPACSIRFRAKRPLPSLSMRSLLLWSRCCRLVAMCSMSFSASGVRVSALFRATSAAICVISCGV